MSQIVIERSVINSPFQELSRHFKFRDHGLTNQIDDGRWGSSHFVPIPRPDEGQRKPAAHFGYRVSAGPRRRA